MLRATAGLAATSAAGAGGTAGLATHAARTGRFYGAAINNRALRQDPDFMAHVPAECAMVVGEGGFKWWDLRPAPDRFDYTLSDRLVGYAEAHRLRVRGHTLLWHEANPAWLARTLAPGNAEALLTEHVRNVAGRYRGRLAHWDVVNEVIEPRDHRPDGLRDSLWLRALGPRYIDLAFRLCAETDPFALRVLNDYGMEYASDDNHEPRRRAMLRLLAALKARGVPVQALGIQAHLDAAEKRLDQKRLARFLDDVAALGLAILVTEFDVNDRSLPADITTRDAGVAAHARAYLDVVLANRAVIGVLSWGLSDRYSSIGHAYPRHDGAQPRPLPLDAELRRKPLWSAMAAAFDAAQR